VEPLSNTDSRYTAASWAALQTAVTDAERVLDDATATQAQIDAATTSLGAALVGLQLAKTPAPPVVKVAHVKKIKLNQTQLRLVKGKTFRLRSGVYYGDGHAAYAGKTTWKSSRPKIATVTSTGKIKAKKAGTVTITATTTETTATGKRLSAKIRVKVVKKRPKAKVVKVRASVPKTMRRGQVVYVTGTYTSTRATGVKVSYSTSKPGVVALDKVGRLVAKRPGTASITVRAQGKTVRYRIVVR